MVTTRRSNRPSSTFRVRAARLPIGPLVGRDADARRVIEALSSSRLVTILGPPGIGKTRLAGQTMELASDAFTKEGGIWFCDLTGITDASGLVHTVTALVQGQKSDGASPSEGAGDLVDRFVAAGPMLVVLDNFEQLVSAADVVHGWCQAAPELSVLVTSRERLRVEGEVVIELGPLACPAPNATDSDILASDAVQLLVLRAKAAGGDVGSDAQLLGELVRQLDGIPLAIELAAARTRVLRPADLVTRLSQRSDVLARRPLHERDRHATLAAAIDWSWQLLSADEQRALRECSIFARSFTVTAAEALLGEQALDLLGALRDKSLVHLVGEGQLAMYASIREYAAARLSARDAAEVTEVHRRHAAFFAAKARAFVDSRSLQGGPDGSLRAELLEARADLLSALAFVRERSRDVKRVAELALALTLLQAAPAELCLTALQDALSSIDEGAGGPESDSLVPLILLWRQTLLAALGRFDESRSDMTRLLSMNLQPTFRTLSLVMQGTQLRYRGLIAESWESHLAATRSIDADTPTRLLAMHYACMGRLGHELRQFETARENNERARILAAGIGDAWLEGLPLANLALLEQELGDFDLAERLLDEALRRLESTDEQHYVAVYSIASGDLAFERGRPEEARQHYAKAERFFLGWRAYRQATELHSSAAALEAFHGALDEAELHLERARQSLPKHPPPFLEVLLEVHGAQLALRRVRDSRSDADGVYARIRARSEELARGPIAESTFTVRFALRMLAQALAASPSKQVERAPVTVTVARDGAWFSRDGLRVDLRRRGSLRRILAALVASEKRGASRAQLLAEGWPGERLLHDAAGKRLRVAVATLRSLGLRDVILTLEEGYALDPSAGVVGEL